MLLDWAIENSIVTAILSCVVLGICRLRSIGPAWRHALWLIVMLKLMSPPLIAWPIRLPGITVLSTDSFSIGTAVYRSGQVPSDYDQQVGPMISRVVSNESIIVPRRPIASPAASTAPRNERWRQRDSILAGASQAAIRLTLYGMWIGGALFVGAVQTIRIRRMRRIVKRSHVDNDQLTPLVARLAKELGVRSPRIATTDEIRTPLIWAFGRPTLVLPSRLVATSQTENESQPQYGKATAAITELLYSRTFPADPRLSQEAFSCVLVHELAHLKRRDHWIGWIELLASCVWWWNPVFWLVRYQLRENAELACDTWVVSTVPNGRRGYAEALLTICKFHLEPVMAIPVLGIASHGRHAFQRRLEMILQESKTSKLSRMGILSFGLCAALVLPSWSQDSGIDELFSAGEIPAEVPAADDASFDGDSFVGDLSADSANDSNNDLFDDERSRSTKVREQNRLGTALVEALNNPKSLDKASRSRMIQLGRKWIADHQYLPSGFRQEMMSAVARLEAQELKNSSKAETVTLERTTYRLPANKARQFSDFLRQAVDEDAASVRMRPSEPNETSDESYLVITATPEAQQAISKFIAFLRISPAPKSKPYADSPRDSSDSLPVAPVEAR